MNDLIIELVAKHIIELNDVNVIKAMLRNICYPDNDNSRINQISSLITGDSQFANKSMLDLTKVKTYLLKHYDINQILKVNKYVFDDVDKIVYISLDYNHDRWFEKQDDVENASWRGVNKEDSTHHIHSFEKVEDSHFNISYDEDIWI